jgi:hypothetical protein
VPFVDVLLSAQIRSINPANAPGMGAASATNGNSLNATTQVPNTVVRDLLGRLPGTELAFQSESVDLLTDGQLYPDERVNQVDMRFAKIVRLGDRRLDIGVDLYNLFNSNTTTTFQQTYLYTNSGATWLDPTAILAPRLARFNATLSF